MSRKLAPLDFSGGSNKRLDRPGTVPIAAFRNNNNPRPHFVPEGGAVESLNNLFISNPPASTTRSVSFRIPNSISENALSQDALKHGIRYASNSSTTSNPATMRLHHKSDIELRATPPHPNAPGDITRSKSKSMDEIGVLKTSSNEVYYDFGVGDLKDLGQIGAGSYGTVNKMRHVKSNSLMAVKIIRVSVNETEQRQVKMDLGVIRKASYKHIVTFYGAIFHEGDCWICMELMDLSAELTYRYVHHTLHEVIPENVMAQIALATVRALQYLREKLEIIHRDVKPSNILINKQGCIKLCDFGISGVLVDSIARTHDVGCRPYMAPERIDPSCEKDGYDIRSDVWSMGITLIEIATGSFPYRSWSSVFDQLQEVVTGDPPKLKDLPNLKFSHSFHSFIHSCLKKERRERPKYTALLKCKFLEHAAKDSCTDMSGWVRHILEKTSKIKLPEVTKVGNLAAANCHSDMF